MHKAEVTITRMSEGKTNKLFVGSMSDDKALELASKIVSEGFIFSVTSYLSQWSRLVTLCARLLHVKWCSSPFLALNVALVEQLVFDRLPAVLVHGVFELKDFAQHGAHLSLLQGISTSKPCVRHLLHHR